MKESLSRKFDINDMGKLHYFLGMQVVQDQQTGDTWIGQPNYNIHRKSPEEFFYTGFEACKHSSKRESETRKGN